MEEDGATEFKSTNFHNIQGESSTMVNRGTKKSLSKRAADPEEEMEIKQEGDDED